MTLVPFPPEYRHSDLNRLDIWPSPLRLQADIESEALSAKFTERDAFWYCPSYGYVAPAAIMPVRVVVALTDPEWFQHLQSKTELSEVNF